MGLPLIARQPFKGIYVACSLVGAYVFRYPWWFFSNLIPAFRPRRSWTLWRCIALQWMRYRQLLGQRVNGLDKWPDHRALDTRNGVLGVYIDGTPELITGNVEVWASTFNGVDTVRIPGYWYHKDGMQLIMGQKPDPTEKVVLWFHGGGYTGLSAHPSAPSASRLRSLFQYTGPELKRALAVEYRLSSTDPNPRANPFPAALMDAVAGYAYLVNAVGFAPSQIIVAGDSAGGNLALALTRYLVERDRGEQPKPAGLPAPPAGQLLLSPWVDLGKSHEVPGGSPFTCAECDFIFRNEGPGYGPTAFMGRLGVAAGSRNVYVSPASRELDGISKGFKGFPKAFIAAGDAEILFDQIKYLAKIMTEENGEENVEYYEAKDSVHVYMNLGPWAEPQKGETWAAIANWIATL